MAPSRGTLATILGMVAGSFCALVTDPVMLSAKPVNEVPVLLLPPLRAPAGALDARMPLLSNRPIDAPGWEVHGWEDCPLTSARSGCHICVGSPLQMDDVEARMIQIGYQKSSDLAVPRCTPAAPAPPAQSAAPAAQPAAPMPSPQPAPSQPVPKAEMPAVVESLPMTTKPPRYVLNAGKDGLPISDGKRPSWLLKEDELILDARKVAYGGILIVQPVLMDAGGSWGQNKASRPRWLRAILATNRHHARLHGHCIILRWQPTQPQLTKWQRRQCGKTDEKSCTRQNERENFNWEKHL
ncbi:Uncharacterized protein SCF082_LOCUS8745, partial [Durusdinium trenchii]